MAVKYFWAPISLIVVNEAYFHFQALTLYSSLFCHLHLCPDLYFNISIVFGSFWLASPFLQISSLVTKVKYLRGNPGLPLPALLAKKFSCCVSYFLVEVGDHGVQISICIYQSSKMCKSTTYSCHCKVLSLTWPQTPNTGFLMTWLK